MKRPRHPRINCTIPGCRRGTTQFAPETEVICGKHWRAAPKALRDRYSRYRRHARILDRRGDKERATRWHRRAWMVWERIKTVLTADAPDDGDMPPLMAEALRQAGLD